MPYTQNPMYDHSFSVMHIFVLIVKNPRAAQSKHSLSILNKQMTNKALRYCCDEAYEVEVAFTNDFVSIDLLLPFLSIFHGWNCIASWWMTLKQLLNSWCLCGINVCLKQGMSMRLPLC